MGRNVAYTTTGEPAQNKAGISRFLLLRLQKYKLFEKHTSFFIFFLKYFYKLAKAYHRTRLLLVSLSYIYIYNIIVSFSRTIVGMLRPLR